MILRSLRTQMFVLVFGLVAAVQIALLFAVDTAHRRIADQSIERHLESAELLFREVVRNRDEQLLQAAEVLSADFAFRKTIAIGDLETAVSALRNQSRRIGADSAILVGPDGRILADTLSGDHANRPVDDVIRVSWDENGRSGIGWIGHEAHQLLAVPIRAPLTIAHLVMSFRLDDELASQLQQLTGLEVAFVATSRDVPYRVAATVQEADWQRLTASAAHGGRTSGARYEAIVAPIGAVASSDLCAVLMVDRKTITDPFLWLRSLLIGLAAVGLAVSAFGAIAVARGISRPLSSMADIAGRYAVGNFDDVPESGRPDELGVLASALGKMRDGLLERENRILKLAYRDRLTGLANRTLFVDRLKQSLALGRRERSSLTVLVLDIDRFKEVNGTLGHRCGDRVLREVGWRLRSLARESDTIARLGGDEFAVLLPGTGAEGAETLARKIHEVLREPVSIDGDPIDVSASIGAAVYPDHGDDLASLLARADIAMYSAKASGSGYERFDGSLETDHRGRLSMLGELRRALEADQIELWFQPKIDAASGCATAVEALVRWRHPERGLVNPMEFIEFAERTGFIKEITARVVDLAARQSAAWRDAGIDLRISINVSARDLYDRRLPEYLHDRLHAYGVEPNALVLEITETAMMASPENALEVLMRLREDGLGISIDDFGMGYSSLSYLRRLPSDELKIDREFVKNMTGDPESSAIVRAAVDLGHTMGMRVVAEGVEDAEIWQALVALGCDYGQGYWFSKPLAAPDLEQWLTTSIWSPFADPEARAG